MKKYKILTLFLLLLLATPALAQDTLVVHPFSFENDPINGVFRDTVSFPDGSETYRKILMHYTLKCDTRTTQDQYACGEWDYLTYNKLYFYTGEYDSTLRTHPKYKLVNQAPDTIRYTSQPLFDTYQYYEETATFTEIIEETDFTISDGDEELIIDKPQFRMQFLLDKNEVEDLGISEKKDVVKIQLFSTSDRDVELKNLRVLYASTIKKKLDQFEDDKQRLILKRDFTLKPGWNNIVFDDDRSWSKIFGMAVELSFENPEYATNPVKLAAKQWDKSIGAYAHGHFVQFDGANDYADTKIDNQLDGVTQFTFETWLKVDTWQNWNDIFTKNGDIVLQLGNSHEVYCIVRNQSESHNSYGYATGLVIEGEWIHLAMVYNGQLQTNEEKMKLYANGEQVELTFNLDILAETPTNDANLLLTNISRNNASLEGGMDEIRIWTTALSGDVIAEWYQKDLDDTHENYTDLLAYYPVLETDATELEDKSTKGMNAEMYGLGRIQELDIATMTRNLHPLGLMPNWIVSMGEYELKIDSMLKSYDIRRDMYSIYTYDLDYKTPILTGETKGYLSGYTYTYDSEENRIDSVFVEHENQLINYNLTYYSDPFEIVNVFEIGRYITPYGMGIDLGENGFMWKYDVTDYAPLLRGDVELRVGNRQELVDVKFLFIKGTPPRDVLAVQQPWGNERSYLFKDMAADTVLKAVTVDLNPNATQFKLKTRLTGHGHNKSEGANYHCCEWMANQHSMIFNGEDAINWYIYTHADGYNDCARNPVYPQGGNWEPEREGWCPGDVVRDFDFEITPYVQGNQVTLDYAISDVPSDNTGTGNGNYRTCLQVIEYADNNFENDAEIYEVMAPSDWDYHKRWNPTCGYPVVIVRNNGVAPMTSLTFKYSMSGGSEETFEWQGNIAPHAMDTLIVPLSGDGFWLGDSDHIFSMNISNPNGQPDEYADNDSYSLAMTMPDFYKDPAEIHFKTNKMPQYLSLRILDIHDEAVWEKSDFNEKEASIAIPLDFPDGCYRMIVTNSDSKGLYYSMNNAMIQEHNIDYGRGDVRIVSQDGQPLKYFSPTFGYELEYNFHIGDMFYIHESNLGIEWNVYPNPSKDIVNIEFGQEIAGMVSVDLIDMKGNILYSDNIEAGPGSVHSINLDALAAGTYIVRLTNAGFRLTKNFVKK